MSSKFQNDAIFWVEVEKIKPNPYQPRRDFNEDRLRDLAESIRQYGVLQPLTVTRREHVKEDGGLKVEYELIAGERRHRASQLANLSQVPVIIRSGDESSQVKLELAIIENLQREDLNPVERAEAFDQLAQEFDFTHKQIAEKIGKSREYVSNSLRLLKLPEEIKMAIISGQMTEGHARPIMMLRDKPEQQETLFKEVVHKGLTVREAESIARRDAQDKVRKKKNKINPQTKQLEDRLSDTFGTRVKIEERDVGGKLVIDFFSEEDLENIIKLVQAGGDMEVGDMMEQYVESIADEQDEVDDESEQSEGASEGKSMADTLSTMIAAARKQHAAKEAAVESSTDGEIPSESVEQKQTDDSSEIRDQQASADVTEYVEEQAEFVEEEIDDTAEVTQPSEFQEQSVNVQSNNSEMKSRGEAIETEKSDNDPVSTPSDNEGSGDGLEVSDMMSGAPEQPKDENNVEEEITNSWSAQENDSDLDTESEPVAKESDFTDHNDATEQRSDSESHEMSNEDTEEDNEKDEDEIYAVSNFSI